MPKTQALNTISINPSLISFKPHQVLLANPKLKPNMNKASVPALKPVQKALLLRSVAEYLKSNGFSKTLKKFLSEAQLEKDDLSDCSLDLEHMCCMYFEACDNGSTVSSKKVQDLQMDDNSKRGGEAESAAAVETVSKKKKKRSDEDGHAVVMQSEDSGKLTDSNETGKEKSKEKRKSKKISDSLSQEDEPENKHKDKKKKKGKLDSESLADGPLGLEDKQGNEAKESEPVRHALAAETTATNGNNVTSLEDESVKFKGKKKKKGDSVSENDCNKTSEEETTDKERKGSKKRKRLASEENNAEPIDEKEVEESKRRKTEGSEELKRSDDQVNGNLEKKEEKSAPNKSMKKQLNGSAEPKTVTAFQRVKVDEVVFTDERLKDNSYWAKDGAEIGYGAKAQEVLGQVRGRGFRHEKTKKKRGSYRGGQIDLQSHSVKFNYSDEE